MTDSIIENSAMHSVQFAHWLAELTVYESASRILAAIGFAGALLLSGFQLQRGHIERHAAGVPSASRICFIGGLVFSVAHFSLAVVSPQSSTTSLVTPGLVCLLTIAVMAIDFDHDRLPAFTFLTSAIAWVLLVLTPFLIGPQIAGANRELSYLGKFHIFAAISGESIFVLSFLTSLVYIFVHKRLKQKLLSDGPQLPSLESLDNLVGRSSFLGLALITSSLVSGLAMLAQGFSLKDVGLVKILWAFGIWAWYVIAIFGRAKLGWRGKKGANASVISAALMALALFGTFWN